MNIYALPTPHSIHYLNRYLKLISYAIQHPSVTEFNEEHHILPESMGGDNKDTNLVILSARQHYLAHWMLWKAYKSKEMTSAFFAMSNQNNQYQGRTRRITSRTYELLRMEFAQLISVSTTELWQDSKYRQKHIDTNNTPKTKNLRSQKAKELWGNLEYRQKQHVARKEAWASGRFKRDHSKCGNKGDANVAKRPEVKAKNSGVNHYSNREGYVKPSCIHCGITSTLTNIKRWHNNNCKLKV
jgi:hypothetical protein